jgi:AcrR family transcriptional regulator
VNKKTSGRMLINEKKGLQRRTVLIAAANLFSEKGYAGTSMADLASSLGISRPALYYYFDSKEEILTSMVEEVTLAIKEMGETRADGKRDPAETLYEMVKTNARFVLNNAVLFKVIDRSGNFFPEKTKLVNAQATRAIFDKFKAVIERGIKSGHFKKMNPSIGAFAVLGIYNWSAWWYQAGGILSDEEVASQIASMALASVRQDGIGSSRLDDLRPALASVQAAMDQLTRLVAPTHRGK